VTVATRLSPTLAARVEAEAARLALTPAGFVRHAVERAIGIPDGRVAGTATETAAGLARLAQTLAAATRDVAAMTGRVDRLRVAARPEKEINP
jgi:hypothetical protein